jgi:hypothetical protein
MKELFDAGWQILNIHYHYDGVEIKLWYPVVFAFMVAMIWRIITVRERERD